MGRGHNQDFASSSCGTSKLLERIAVRRQQQGPCTVLVQSLRTVGGVPVGTRAERRMAARELRKQEKHKV